MAGLLLGQGLGLSWYCWLLLLLPLMIGGLKKREKDLIQVLFLTSLMLLGAARGAWCREPAWGTASLEGFSMTASGRVIQVQGRRLVIKDIVIENNSPWRGQRKLLLSYPVSVVEDRGIRPGDQVSFRGTGRQLQGPANPGAFDARRHYGTQGIFMELVLEELALQTKGPWWRIGVWSLREKMVEALARQLPKEERAIVLGCLLGDTGEMDPGHLWVYRRAGIGHLFAVSGTHGHIVLSLVLCFSHLLARGRPSWKGTTVAFGMLVLYGALTGFPLSMERTLIMSAGALLQPWLPWRLQPLTPLSLAALTVLALEPGRIFAPSFQLSFGLVLGLIHLEPWLKKTVLPGWLRLPVAAALTAMPLQAYWFQQFQPLALLLNLGAMLLMFPLLALAFLGTLLMPWPFWSGLFWQGCGFLAWLLHKGALIWGSQSWSCWYVAQAPWPWYLVWALLLWGLPTYRYYYLAWCWRLGDWDEMGKRKLKALIAVALLLLSGGLGHCLLKPKPLEVVFLDVGEGDAAVIHTPQGRTWLMDAGGTAFSDYPVGLQVVLPYLKYKGVNRLEGILLSHYHLDHYEGIQDLLNYLPIDRLWLPEPDRGDPGTGLFLEALAASKQKLYWWNQAKGSLELEPGLTLEVVWPWYLAGCPDWSENDRSLFARLVPETGPRILFTGDAEKRSLAALRGHSAFLEAEILKMPHHGSASSYVPAFYEAVSPLVAVVCGGRQGPAGDGVRPWFDQRQLPFLTTRRDGAVTVQIDPQGWYLRRMDPSGGPVFAGADVVK